MARLSRPRIRLHKQNLDFIRPKEWRLELGVQHNWGDYYLHENSVVIRVYGCPQGPHVLPIFVSPKLAFMEIMWQLNEIDHYHLGKQKGLFSLMFFPFQISLLPERA